MAAEEFDRHRPPGYGDRPGLVHKYNVERVDGDPEGKHAECRYFVLDPVHDEKARRALIRYSALAELDEDWELVDDIRNWLHEIDAQRRVDIKQQILSKEAAAREERIQRFLKSQQEKGEIDE